MSKIAYNACFGGFSLSRKAVLLGRKLSGDDKWCPESITGDKYEDGKVVDTDFGFIPNTMARHDPILIAVVEKLGRAASGTCADIRLEEVESGTLYRIDEYDGNESVMTQSGYEWSVAP